jgi:UDP-N-acetyl-D-glucosamine/UDP-N-acetyl-D-galactosamine dehydrogenase
MNPTNPTKPIPIECVGVIGLGYVGLSLASAFGRIIPTIGFDINHDRIRELQEGYDRTGEIPPEALKAPQLVLSTDPDALRQADFLIVTVPTPVDRAKRPDLSHLINSSRLLGRILKAEYGQPKSDNRQPQTTDDRPQTGDRRQETQHPTPKTQTPIIVYESTVYPGCTEEVCIPVLEQESGLKAGKNFMVGYSPERINPGDSEHTLETITKVVAGQDVETTGVVAEVYGLVVKAGVYKAPDIRTAEAAKVIENIQRDLNIALMNELAMLFHRLGIDTHEVLKAARTKWNFLPFEAGLVGGHCIPVDPYYLTHKAQEIGYHPDVILAGRRINDSMGVYVAQESVKLLIKAGKTVHGARALMLGVTFKQDVRDVRNSRAVDLAQELESYGVEVFVHDPFVGDEQIKRLGLTPTTDPFSCFSQHPTSSTQHLAPKTQHPTPDVRYDAVILAVPHRVFREREPEEYLRLLKTEGGSGILVDIRGVLPRESVEKDRVVYWSL